MNIRNVQTHYHNYRPVVIPTIYIIISYLLAFLIPRINYNLFPWLVSPLSSTIIIPFLSSIASGMIALTGIVFSLAFVLQQFITSSYSPRIVQVTGRGIQPHSIGMFTATFIFCLIALRSVSVDDTDPNGSLILWVAFFWLLGSVLLLILLIVQVGDMSIVRILFFLEEAGIQAITKIYPIHSGSSSGVNTYSEFSLSNTVPVSYLGETQYIAGYSRDKLLSLACRYDAVIYISVSIGDCITDGDPVFHIKGGPIPRKALFNSIDINWERTIKNDPLYSIRLFVDVAIRALSPAVNDPATAVQALDHLENLLKKLGNSNLAIGTISDSKNMVRVTCHVPTWNDYLKLSLLEILQYGNSSLQIQRRIRALLCTLKKSVTVEHQSEIERLEKEQLAIINDTIKNEFYRSEATKFDRQGLGGEV